MGEASRRKKEGREVKDPLRFQRANVSAKDLYVRRLQNAYHAAKADYDEHVAKLEKAVEKLKANGHPLYQDAPETVSAAATSGEVASDAGGE